MEKFIVSARKYRPQNFDTVVGQSHITTTLKNAIKHNQLAHAFLFCGPRGVGKTTCARILAKTINCESRTKDGEACNKCNSCQSFNNGTSLNIHELDAASNNSVDDIRTLVEQVRFAPQAGKYKVYIIDEVHMLSSSAFNAFLKTLEEPPPYAIFILATTEKHKILPTILSRCQIFDFKRITIQDTVHHMEEICRKEKIQADTAALQVIAQKSEGCMRDALSIMDKIVSFTNGEVNYQNTLEHLNILDDDNYFSLLDCMLKQDLAGAMLLYDDINRKGFEGDQVINGFSEFLRNLMVSKDEKVAGLLEVVESFREKYKATAKQVPMGFLISALNVLNESEIHYKGARNKRLHVELALIKLCYLNQAIELVSEGQAVVKKKRTDIARPVAYRPIENLRQEKESRAPATARLTVDTRVETPAKKEAAPIDESKPTTPATGGKKSKLTALDQIRKQFKGGNQQGNTGEGLRPLILDDLRKAWDRFADLLKEEKNSAAASFEMAVLRIREEHIFDVITTNNLQQKFLEKERIRASEFLQQALNNRALQFSIFIEENPDDQPTYEAPLTAREQYQKMVEQYPLVKELKDRLRLELDY